MVVQAAAERSALGSDRAAPGPALDAIELTRSLDPDLVLMDIRMPRLDGIAATRALTAADADRPRVLVLTTFALEDYVFDALRAGASGFLVKDSPPERLLGAVHLVSRGDALLDPEPGPAARCGLCSRG